MSKLLKIREVAEMLGCHKQTLYAYIAAGKLRAVRLNNTSAAINRHWRIDEAEVERFLKVNSTC